MTDFDPEKFRLESPALFRRWVKTGEGKRWAHQQTRAGKKEAERTARHPNRRLHWSEDDDELLRRLWGSRTLNWFSVRLCRSPRAVSHRARTLELGPASAMYGAMSLRRFSRYSGFSPSKIKNAARVLRLVLVHSPNSEAGSIHSKNRRGTGRIYQRGRTLAISTEQQEKLVAYMLEHDVIRRE